MTDPRWNTPFDEFGEQKSRDIRIARAALYVTLSQNPADRWADIPEIITFGRKIHDAGGFRAMQIVYYDLCDLLPSPKGTDARLLNHLWDGIGEWRA